MTIYLKQSTASQEVPLGYFVDSTDGNTEKTGLTIANTDIKVWKTGATTLANKNSGGGTHISNGIYYTVLDATDTDTLGSLVLFVHVSGALTVRLECVILAANIYDSLIGGGDILDVSMTQILGAAVSSPATAGVLDVNVKNMNNVAASSITTVNANVGTTQPVNFTGTGASALAKSDMVDVAGAAVSTSSAQLGVNAVQAGGTAWGSGAITAESIAADAIGASELAADAITEIQSGLATAASIAALNNLSAAQVNAEADTALADAGLTTIVTGRIDAAISTRLASASYTAPDNTTIAAIAGYVDTEVAAIKAKTDNLPAAPAAVADIPTAIENADALLKRDWTAVSGEAARSMLNALRFLRNKWSISSSTLTVTKEDDTTSAWTATVSTDGMAEPVIGNDPS